MLGIIGPWRRGTNCRRKWPARAFGKYCVASKDKLMSVREEEAFWQEEEQNKTRRRKRVWCVGRKVKQHGTVIVHC